MTIRHPNLTRCAEDANFILSRILLNAPEAQAAPCEVEFEDEVEPLMPDDDDCIEFLDGQYLLVPIAGERQAIGRTVPVLRWRFSGPHVYGGHCPRSGEPLEGPEPEEADFDSFHKALAHFATVFTMDQLDGFGSMLAERDEAEALAEADAAAAAYFMEG